MLNIRGSPKSIILKQKIFAIDNDKWAYKNAIENAKQNNSKNISFFLGELSQIKKQNFDIVYANINRNIIY